MRIHTGRRFDVDEHIGHSIQVPPFGEAHFSSNKMRLAHCEFGIDCDVQIDMVLQTTTAGITLFNRTHSTHSRRDGTNVVE
jgi:hypothetical protein